MKFYVETYYRFKKRKDGVAVGMDIEAESDDEAIEKAKAECIGPRWPSRIWAGSRVTPC